MNVKKTFLFSFLLMSVWADVLAYCLPNRPDSLFLFSYSTTKNRCRNGLHFAWSADGSRWTKIGNEYGFLTCDYGSWSTQKRMIDPVLERNADGIWFCSWLVNENDKIIARTQSLDLLLWKPQEFYKESVIMRPDRSARRDSIYFSNGEKAIGQIHKVESRLVDNLIGRYDQKAYRSQLDAEQMKDDALRFKGLLPVRTQLTVQPGPIKRISKDLIGIFFEDINYGADGGLYAELIQNRDFEYNLHDKLGTDPDWNAMHSWKVKGDGLTFTIDTVQPIHIHNPHYALLNVKTPGSALVNEGWDGIALQKGEKYDFSLFGKRTTGTSSAVSIILRDNSGSVVASSLISIPSGSWKKVKSTMIASSTVQAATLEIIPSGTGGYAFDMVSLFPHNTFKNRPNGLRKDLAQTLADLHPRFVRFPGGCVAHGDGLGNIYRWKNTIGPLESRVPQRNLWGYHQTAGLGYYEFFQFCEDIGAKPLPVLAAGVPCQNSQDGGAGQQCGIPMNEMKAYIQEILDLIEWANGDPKTSYWGRLRAEAGHIKPFGLELLGIGNEDLISEVFKDRFKMIYEAVHAKYPKIKIVGTVGPFYEGSDYEEGWKLATELKVPIVDEHYYNSPGWFINNRNFYDNYDRSKPHVYLGEYASHLPGRPNNIETALSCALYLTDVERNADVVEMSSYAPLFGKENHCQWRPDMIYFDNTKIKLTTDYYVQKLYGTNGGDEYVPCTWKIENENDAVSKRLGQSVIRDSHSGDVIVKLANLLPVSATTVVDLKGLVIGTKKAVLHVLKGNPTDTDAIPSESAFEVGNKFDYEMPPYSFSVIRIKGNLLMDKILNR